ncbi:hypothetical protein BU251_05850 [Candidatus Velamenicoccus archaeovorus]|uniref:Uncharacterized protein n=1 Tax=Velamenicoccus archaeovorus TaxID=1930593 RepID=A0A410P4Z8_VELA1|nr:hypothetical protein [Candidatus Velamenicoccus archaeovorus]QAT17287.1 hypothetical protein BU251_05850 [Candidatus Velamenicoccus archaeovorus]
MRLLIRGMTVCLVLMFILQASGCETLRKKFTRKRKTQTSNEVMVVSPRDYGAHPFPNNVMYKQYFAYWKSWNQELVTALNDRASDKKVLECVNQSLINLEKMMTYLKDDQAAALSVYAKQTQALQRQIQSKPGLSTEDARRFRYTAERILSCVNREFDSTKMKAHLKPDPS